MFDSLRSQIWVSLSNFIIDSVSLVSTSTDESSEDSSSTTSSINRRQHLPGASSYSESGSSWVSSIETLTAVEKLPQDSETLSKISSHVMHIVNPTETSSQVIGQNAEISQNLQNQSLFDPAYSH